MPRCARTRSARANEQGQAGLARKGKLDRGLTVNEHLAPRHFEGTFYLSLFYFGREEKGPAGPREDDTRYYAMKQKAKKRTGTPKKVP